jgi:N6-adenosine-specific RNA methylase IME4
MQNSQAAITGFNNMNTQIYIQHPIGAINPKLQDWEYQELKTDILKNGIQQPIVIYEGKILDGWHKYNIAVSASMEFPTTIYTGSCPTDYVASTLEGRNLTKEHKAAIMLALNGDRIPVTIKTTINAPTKGKKGFTATANPNSSRSIAKKLNINRDTVQKVTKLKNESPEIFDKVVKGDLTYADAARIVKRNEVKQKLDTISANAPQTPTDKFQVMVIDPPWQMEKIKRDVAPEQVDFDYPTMDIEQIKALPLLKDFADNDCHVFLWTTHKHLPYAFDILTQWGVKYVFTMVWHKNGGFQPFNLPQYNNEFCLYGKIGNPQFLDTKAFNTCFNADRTKHSEKPKEFYDLLNRITGGRRLDVFNRRKIEGFIGWGNEAK